MGSVYIELRVCFNILMYVFMKKWIVVTFI